MYDLIVIGAGAGGLTTAFGAIGFNKKVLLIDKENPGGECTWSGCIPSKALINIANEIHIAKKYSDFTIDGKNIMNRVREIISEVFSHEDPVALKNAGIDYIRGHAKIINKKQVKVNNTIFKTKNIVISTGSSPFVPPIKGLENIDYLTNENIFKLENLPKSITILGGGAIGIELGQALSRLEVEVSLIERNSRIHPKEDEEMSKFLTETLEKEGIKIYTGYSAEKVTEDDSITVTAKNKNDETVEVSSEKLLVALGRQANLKDLGLEELGIKHDGRKIFVDSHLQTSQKSIYCVGDVIGPYQFSHMANYQGQIVVQNLFLPVKKKVNYEHIGWCTFSHPELASIGINEEEAIKKFGKDNIKLFKFDEKDSDRAITKANDTLKIKIITDKKLNLLGASILGERAGELICELQALKSNNLTLDSLYKIIHPYPTYSNIYNKIGTTAYVEKFSDNKLIKALRNLLPKKKFTKKVENHE